MTYFMDQEEWRFLHADLRAGSWVLDTDPDAEPGVLLRKFFSIHQFFLRNIGRDRPELFRDVPKERMLDVVRRWIVLYRRTLAALGERFPRRPGTPDLRLAGVNWSEAFGISFEGIVKGTSSASRYAELWAERSLKSEGTFETFEARLAFVGTPDYWRVFERRLAKRLVVNDDLANAVTSFDLIGASAGASGAEELRQRFVERGWEVDAIDEESAAVLIAGTLAADVAA